MNDDTKERLISRVVDREEAPSDWDQLECDPSLERELLVALRCDAELRAALDATLPTGELAHDAELEVHESSRAVPPRLRILRHGSAGWLAAAALLIAWFLQTSIQPTHSPVSDPVTKSLVRELDPVIVETRPATSGNGFDVLYVRRVLETRRVSEVFGFDVSDQGTWTPVRRDDVPRATTIVF